MERIAAVRALNLLDTPPEDRFDRITRLARDLFDVPIAQVTLVDVDRQWAKSSAGGGPRELARGTSFCSATIDAGRYFEVSDASTDPRFATSPAVLGPAHVRFYAGHPVAAPSGHLVGALCVLDRVPRRFTARQREELGELAEWVRLECAVVQVTRWEEAAERARRDFVSIVSHELRTPLTSIHGSLELIASGRFGALPPRVAGLVDIAARNTDRLVRLSQDVVDLHQVHRGRLHLRLDDIGLTEVVSQAVNAVDDVAERAGVAVTATWAATATVRGDADRLVQVVTNLLVNAVRVSPEGTGVAVTCGKDGPWAWIEVRDHAPKGSWTRSSNRSSSSTFPASAGPGPRDRRGAWRAHPGRACLRRRERVPSGAPLGGPRCRLGLVAGLGARRPGRRSSPVRTAWAARPSRRAGAVAGRAARSRITGRAAVRGSACTPGPFMTGMPTSSSTTSTWPDQQTSNARRRGHDVPAPVGDQAQRQHLGGVLVVVVDHEDPHEWPPGTYR
ncbi:histidine kinase dimerization/phospho-acceptor domain-containing protein [Umezawaea sp. NPDC059074]|uniref:histidine kinase dimerization/phospho-acceptor domain-containing protein n=1 Tax=Umezawaea sp. NPDC059074 TaxID=3346716 RepID=UPI003691529A